MFNAFALSIWASGMGKPRSRMIMGLKIEKYGAVRLKRKAELAPRQFGTRSAAE